MSSVANAKHINLINKLKMIEKYKDDAISIAVETWSFINKDTKSIVNLWSHKQESHIFIGSKMVDLERFINKERKEAGIFNKRK